MDRISNTELPNGGQVSAVKIECLLVSARDVAKLLSVSVRSVWRQESGGRLPRSVSVGRLRRWRRQEIIDWVAAGCPSRSEWEGRCRHGQGRGEFPGVLDRAQRRS
jgi:predicted DNA-binding transcriptional regulator AlpA